MAKKTLTCTTEHGVFTRTTARNYSHVVVCQYSEEIAREKAYNYKPNEYDRRNFDYYASKVALGVEGLQREHSRKWSYEESPERFQKEYEDAVARIEGGWEGYASRLHDHAIAVFEKSLAAGGYRPFAYAWCGRYDLAQKQAQAASRHAQVLGIYPITAA